MSRRPRFRFKRFALAALAAFAGHAFVLPRMFLPLLERPERPVEVSFVDEVPELPPVPDKEPELKPDKKPDKKDKRTADRRKDPEKLKPEKIEKEHEIAKKEEEKKPVLLPPPPAPPPPPPPPPQDEHMAHQKMVDQDKFPDEKDNADAKYLAQKNHRAARDTRALDTNLVRDMRGPTETPVEKSDNKSEQLGAKERKIAELQNRKGQPNKIVRSPPERKGDEGKSENSTPGRLSMRGLTPKSIEQKGPELKPREGVELHDSEPGPLAAAREGNAGERAGSRAKGSRKPNLSLSATDYDKIVGESTAQAERDKAAKAEVSHAEGRWAKLQKKQAAMRSALENFTPDAYVGRESELGTRAHPYAAYIAEMHRSIHKLWAFSFLPSLDSRGALDPFNDMTRWTKVAIVLKESGEVEKATVVRPSGYLPFDAAAWDVVMSSSPFPAPPEAIKSYDGKVYIDWVFHRDDRQCGTDFVIPHILTGDKHTEMPAPASPRQASALRRAL